jgi:hypothetical protein
MTAIISKWLYTDGSHDEVDWSDALMRLQAKVPRIDGHHW